MLRRILERFAGPTNIEILHRADTIEEKETLGNEYGGHTICLKKLPPVPIVYSFGIGEDASFDMCLIERTGCEIFAFDPTPKSAKWVHSTIHDERFKFRQVGVADRDGEVGVVTPANPRHVSLSAPNGRRSNMAISVRRLETLMREEGHHQIDFLKMDIEGFEYRVLDDILASAIRPSQIAVEYHHGMYRIKGAQTRDSVESLRAVGYKLFHVSATGREYSFILGERA